MLEAFLLRPWVFYGERRWCCLVDFAASWTYHCPPHCPAKRLEHAYANANCFLDCSLELVTINSAAHSDAALFNSYFDVPQSDSASGLDAISSMADAIEHGLIPSPYVVNDMVPVLSRALNSLTDSAITFGRHRFVLSVNSLLHSLGVRILIPSRELCVLNLSRLRAGDRHIQFQTLSKRNRGLLGAQPIKLVFIVSRRGIPTNVQKILAPFELEVWEVSR